MITLVTGTGALLFASWSYCSCVYVTVIYHYISPHLQMNGKLHANSSSSNAHSAAQTFQYCERFLHSGTGARAGHFGGGVPAATAAASRKSRSEERERKRGRALNTGLCSFLIGFLMSARDAESVFLLPRVPTAPPPLLLTPLQYEAIKEKAPRLQFRSRSNCSLMTKSGSGS